MSLFKYKVYAYIFLSSLFLSINSIIIINIYRIANEDNYTTRVFGFKLAYKYHELRDSGYRAGAGISYLNIVLVSILISIIVITVVFLFHFFYNKLIRK